jgi:hypothetical protein
VYICAQRSEAHPSAREEAHPSALEEVEGYKKIILFFLKIADLSFQEVQG